MSRFSLVEGSPGLHINDVAHVLVPGRGRNAAGDGLTASGLRRVSCAVDFYIDQRLERRAGVIVPTGYKSPADKKGELWSPRDSPMEAFTGIPEAELMRTALLARGIGATAIRAERYSIDTVTNFVCAERRGYFPDDRPVAIVSQERQLERILRVIAPKTLRREYLGVVVPETGPKEPDGFMPRLFSQMALVGINSRTEDIEAITHRRVTRMWRAVNYVRRVVSITDMACYNEAS